jgi:hypothetical protein
MESGTRGRITIRRWWLECSTPPPSGRWFWTRCPQSEDVLERLEQGLAQVENASATNNDVQGVEMALGAEIHAVEGSLEEAKRVWGESIAQSDREWQEEKLAFTAIFLTMQQQIETLQRTMGDMMTSIRTLQDREVERELGLRHHVGNPIVIDDLEGETDVDSVYEDARDVHVVTELVEIID